MPWIRVDDHFDEHPKFEKISPAAGWLWLKCQAYCNRNLTDGFIPLGAVMQRAWSVSPEKPHLIVGELVEAGLWMETPGGFQVHDYLVYQPSREGALLERASKQAAGRAGGLASAKARAQAPAQAKSKPVPVPVPVPNSVPVPEKTKDPRSSGDDRVGNGSVHDEDEMTAEQAFDEVFWPAYPRKVAKARAKKAWKALKLKDDDEKTMDRIMGALNRDISREWLTRDPDKIPHPATWLNDRRWEDG